MLMPQTPPAIESAQVTPAPSQTAEPAAAPAPEIGKDPEPKKDDKFSARFAALSRQEKAFNAEKAKWKAEKEAEQREWEPRVTQAKRYEELKAKGRTDKAIALEALKELGLSYDDLTKMFLNDSKPTPEMIARATQEQLEAFKREQAEREETSKKSQTDAAKAAEQAAIEQFKGQIGDTLESKPDEYELTQNHAQGIQLVYDVIEEHYKTTGRVLPNEEAIAHVEKHLEAELEATHKAGKIPKKLQKLFGAKAEGEAPAGPSGSPSAPKAPQPQQARTLTNAAQTAAPTPTKAASRSLEESKLEAAKLLKWT